MAIAVRAIEDADRGWVRGAVESRFGSARSVSRGRLVDDVSSLDGFVAERDGERVGVASLRPDGEETELAMLLATKPRSGVGTALLAAVEREAQRRGHAVWLVTTNDNLDAARFYQRRGWDWVDFHRDAVAESRRLKPEIPLLGAFGIPIRHELEFRWPAA